MIWSVGATCNGNGRKKFRKHLRRRIVDGKIAILFPEEGLVYDYQLQDGGVLTKEHDEDDDGWHKKEISWTNWMKGAPMLKINPEMQYSDIIVSTMDLVQGSFLVHLLITKSKKLLCVGPTGSWKTMCIANCLLTGMPSKYIANFIKFAACTSADQTQDIIDGKTG